MSLIPWRGKRRQDDPLDQPIHAMTQWRREMDGLFDRMLRDPWAVGDELFAGRGSWGPSIDVTETDDEFVVQAELAGVDPKDIDISVTGSVLTLTGEKKESSERTGDSFYRAERRFGSFHRAVQLPADVQPDDVAAEFKNGVLTVRVKKPESVRPRKVSIKVSEAGR